MARKDERAAAMELLAACYDGVLATLSVEVTGYPFGSVVPYCLDRSAHPVLLIASIAQHTKNVRADARVSLTVFDRGVADLQAAGRMSYIGDAAPLAPGAALDAAAARYLRYFPEAAGYDRVHDFSFYTVVPRRLRFIAGFGEIHWFDPRRVLRANPFDAAEERHIIDHMNADHADALQYYCERHGTTVPAGVTPMLVGCDGDGINIRIDRRVARIAFDQPVTDLKSVRAALVAMAKRTGPA